MINFGPLLDGNISAVISKLGDSLFPFWEGENLTLSKVVGDLQIGDQVWSN